MPARVLPQSRKSLRGHIDDLTFVTFISRDEIISVSNDTTVRRFRLSDERNHVLKQGVICVIAISPCGRWMATGGRDGKVQLVDLETKMESKKSKAEHYTEAIQSLAFSPDSNQLTSGSKDGKIFVWSCHQRREKFEPVAGPFPWHADAVWCLCYSPDGKKTASCDRGVVLVWESATGTTRLKLLMTIHEHAWSLAWSSNGDFLFVGCIDGNIKRYDSSTGALCISYKAHSDVVSSIALSHSRKFIATASLDKTICFLNPETFEQVGPILKHDALVHSISLSPDDGYIVIGARNPTIRVWSLRTELQDGISTKGKLMTFINTIMNPLERNVADDSPSMPSPSADTISSSSDIELLVVPGQTSIYVNHCENWGLIRKIRSCSGNNLTGKVFADGDLPVTGGSHGDIYKGTIHFNDRTTMRVAIKVIKRYLDQGDDESKKRRLLREIRLWLTLDHRNVLPLLGTTRGYGDLCAMVCPWVDHGHLTSYLKKKKNDLTAQQRWGIINDVALGLEYLHSKFIVHGDISGSNILIYASGRACISDFGLSIVATNIEDSSLALTYQIKGTLYWTAPELFVGCDSGSDYEIENPIARKIFPSVASDIYSFGGIVLQVLSGKRPYCHLSPDQAVVLAISRGELPRRPSSASVVTDDQWKFLMQCWSKETTRRPTDTHVVKFVHDQLIGVVASSFDEPTSRPATLAETL